MSFLKRVSVVDWGAIVGFGAALAGVFFGWVLFPFLVSMNVDKVYRVVHSPIKSNRNSVIIILKCF